MLLFRRLILSDRLDKPHDFLMSCNHEPVFVAAMRLSHAAHFGMFQTHGCLYNPPMQNSSPSSRLFNPVVLILLLALATGGGLWSYQYLNSKPPVELIATTRYPVPVQLIDFSLTDAAGKPVSRDSFRNSWNLLFFGFTHCPDICPTTLQMLAGVEKKLDQENPDHNIVVWFVSVDPERDTPEQIGQYAGFFNPDMKAVTGSDAELRKLTKQMAIAYEIEEHDEGASSYLVDHSSAIIVLNPDAELYGVMTTPHRPKDILSDLQQLDERG